MIILFVIIGLSLLILVHELGHFLTAKIFGVKVEEFGLGFPPRLFGKKRGETTYSVNALPFGGFVKIYGEDDGDLN
ncbi:MAG: site-2 protease family protein, partial [Patescibacteria group bacterium]